MKHWIILLVIIAVVLGILNRRVSDQTIWRQQDEIEHLKTELHNCANDLEVHREI